MPQIRSREIADADRTEVAKLLARGLGYSKRYYSGVLERLKHLRTPPGFPKFGYLMESDRKIVGAILMIFTELRDGTVRCHVTSWYVEPQFRFYATLFYSKALKRQDVTYLNTSARPHAREIINVQGFQKYSDGEFAAVPLAHFAKARSQVKVFAGKATPNAHVDPFERDLLLTHAAAGCVTLWCVESGRAYPFVFRRLLFKGFIPGAQLIYCNAVDDFVRFIWPIARYLALRGILVVRLDTNGPVPGLIGKYFPDMQPRFYKGIEPRLGDLAYTQVAICGNPARIGRNWHDFRQNLFVKRTSTNVRRNEQANASS